MCGIAGLIHRGKSTNVGGQMQNMLQSLKHRGPDKFGRIYLENKHLALGHARLAIRDLSKHGNQPMHSDNRRYFIVFNGEIDNFQSLRKKLSAVGFKFKSSSDKYLIPNKLETLSFFPIFLIYIDRILSINFIPFNSKSLVIYRINLNSTIIWLNWQMPRKPSIN